MPVLNSYPLIDKTLSKIIKTLPYHWTSETLCILKFRIKKSLILILFSKSLFHKKCAHRYLFFLKPLPFPYLVSVLSIFLKTLPSSRSGTLLFQNSKKSITIYGDIELSILITLYFRSLVCISHSLCIGRIDSMQYRANLVILEMLNIS